MLSVWQLNLWGKADGQEKESRAQSSETQLKYSDISFSTTKGMEQAPDIEQSFD